MLPSSGFRSGNGSPYWIPVRRSAAASPSRAAKATGGPPPRPRSPRSDLGWRRTDQAGNVAGADDHRVDARALELSDLVPARDIEIRDRKLAGGDIGQQVEHA